MTASKDPADLLKAGSPPYRSFYESRPRAEGKYPNKPSDLGSSWNFLARNQRARCMQSVGEKYGLHKVAPAELTRRKDAPVFVVTESTDEAAAFAFFQAVYDAGCRHYDTAEVQRNTDGGLARSG